MRESIDLSGTKLSDDEKGSVIALCRTLSDMSDIDVKCICLYGSAARDDYRPGKSDINILVVLEHIDVPVLKKVLDPVSRGRRHGIAPFFITEMNLRSSADVFPVKFLAMQESYQVLSGCNLLGSLDIGREHLRLRCEQQIKNLLLRMRRHYIMASGRGLTQMMSRAIGGLLETMRVLVSLTGQDLPSRDEIVDVGAERFDLDADTLQDVSALRDRDTSLPPKEAEELYGRFMAVVDKVAQVADQMT
ncbi:MAG: nucleotidyltransferase domain-containing protein [Planctomycetota bacterium]